MAFTQTTWFRLSLGLFVLVFVNIAAGVVAETLRYPSLYGATTGIFEEYAYPVPFAYGLVHWVSMLPLALIVAGLPMWDRQLVVRARWIALILLLVSLGFEIDFGVGAFEKNPFALYGIVDSTTFLVVSFAFHTPVRGLLIGIGVVVLVASGVAVYRWDQLQPDMPDIVMPDDPVEVASTPGELLLAESVSVNARRKTARFFIEVVPVIEPGKPPYPQEICAAAESVYNGMLKNYSEAEGFNNTVTFITHPWFVDDPDIVHTVSGAGYVNGEWDCWFTYPQKPVSWRPLGEPWGRYGGVFTSPGTTEESMLVSTDRYDNFRLRLEFNPDEKINSGVFIRCQDESSITPFNCYEINIWDEHPRQEFRTGAIVTRFSPPLAHVDTIGKWNRLEIEATDNLIEVRVNDVLTARYESGDLSTGFIALQGNGEGKIRFRKILVERRG